MASPRSSPRSATSSGNSGARGSRGQANSGSVETGVAARQTAKAGGKGAPAKATPGKVGGSKGSSK